MTSIFSGFTTFLLVAAFIANGATKSLLKMPLLPKENDRVISDSSVAVQPQPLVTEAKVEKNAVEVLSPFEESERNQSMQVSVRMLPKQNSPSSKESDRDLLPVAPLGKPIQMTLVARQTPGAGGPSSTSSRTTPLNHQMAPRQHNSTPTPSRHGPNSREMMESLKDVEIDEYHDDPFQRSAPRQL